MTSLITAILDLRHKLHSHLPMANLSLTAQVYSSVPSDALSGLLRRLSGDTQKGGLSQLAKGQDQGGPWHPDSDA